MKKGAYFALIIMLAGLVSACTVSVTPIPTATGTINLADNSIAETYNEITVAARLGELSVSSYQMVDNISSFYVAVDNRGDQQFQVLSDTFVLRDAAGRQYRSIKPDKVREIVSKDTVYLIPYPYVGYYYLEDYTKVSHFDTFSSALPFYAEYHPQDIFTQALPEGPLPPGAGVAGMVYFLADLERMDRVELLLYSDPDLKGEPEYRFPFAIEK